MTFKTFFYCDRCGTEATKLQQVVFYNILYDIEPDDKSRGYEIDKVDLCIDCHDAVYKFIKQK